jgi:putative FmdB family regulatory protein
MHLLEVLMPTYEYRCLDCGEKVSIYLRYEEYGRKAIRCTHCGGKDLERIIGRVRFARSEGSRMDSIDDWGDIDENDPRAMARMMRQMSDEIGEEMPPEFDEVVGRLEAGESPEEIEQSMPELGESGADLD